LDRPRGMKKLLKLVRKGHIQAHTEISASGNYRVIFYIEFVAELVMSEPPIGVGASGKVYRSVYRGAEVAVKVFSEEMFSFSKEEFQREVSMMRYRNFQEISHK
jgi:hypothetical protein